MKGEGMNRRYTWAARRDGLREDILVETATGQDGQERETEILGIPRATPPEVRFDVLDVVRNAYRDGREDRGSELLPHGSPDVLRTVVHDQALGAMQEWTPGPTDVIDGAEQYRIWLEKADEHYGTLLMAIGHERYQPLKRFRLRLLVEEVDES